MKQFRIYYNIHHENAAIGFEYETKVVEVTMEEAINALTLCKNEPEKYEFLSLERI